jgi:hypothetical protein
VWEYLYKVHHLLPLFLVTGIVIAIMVIALKGKIVFRWGRNAIGIGKNVNLFRNTSGKPKSNGEGETGEKRVTPKKRSCPDCLLIVTNEYERYEREKYIQENKLLTHRMNYTEEKLIEIQHDLIEIFDDRMNVFEKEGHKENENRIIIETKMFFGLLKEALSQAKKEVRRACKEDNFCDLSHSEYINYIENKANVIVSTVVSYLREVYPPYGTLVPIDTIVEDIEGYVEKIQEYAENIFNYAKRLLKDHEEKMNLLENKFNVWSKNFC